MLSLLCSLSLRSLARFSAQSVLLVLFLSHPLHFPPLYDVPLHLRFVAHSTLIQIFFFFPFDIHTELELVLGAVSIELSLPCQYLYHCHDSSSCGYFVFRPFRALGWPLLFSFTMYLFPFIMDMPEVNKELICNMPPSTHGLSARL